MTCSLALRKWRLRDAEYPSAFSSTARRCFLPCTARLTLAIVPSPALSCGSRAQARPRRRSTCFLSPPVTSAPRPSRRVRLLAFFSNRWARKALRRRILPVPVTRNRLAAPRCVLTFGISGSCGRGIGCGRARFVGHAYLAWGGAVVRFVGGAGPRGARRLGLLGGVQHHRHVATVLAGRRFDDRNLA